MYVISAKKDTYPNTGQYLFATGAIRYIKNPKIGNKYYLYLQLKPAQMKCREQKNRRG